LEVVKVLQTSQKCQYALRAVYELAKRSEEGPVSVSEVAAAQAIPPRFLELILGELRKAGYVLSHRGPQGGYELAVGPADLTVGTIIRFIDGPVAPVGCIAGNKPQQCSLFGRCAFLSMWQRAQQAVEEVYDGTTFQDLIDQHEQAARHLVANYCI
jgi:Rrf2 family protein